jgi:hypothetical protein
MIQANKIISQTMHFYYVHYRFPLSPLIAVDCSVIRDTIDPRHVLCRRPMASVASCHPWHRDTKPSLAVAALVKTVEGLHASMDLAALCLLNHFRQFSVIWHTFLKGYYEEGKGSTICLEVIHNVL